MAIQIAVFTLAFLGGLGLSIVITGKISGCLFGVLVTIFVITGLLAGYSKLILSLTGNLGIYIAENPLGFVGFAIGFLLGLVIKKRK